MVLLAAVVSLKAFFFTGEAWSPDPEINNPRLVEQSPVKRELPGEAVLHSQVSRVLDFGDENGDDDETILPVEPPRQISILIVVWIPRPVFLQLHRIGG